MQFDMIAKEVKGPIKKHILENLGFISGRMNEHMMGGIIRNYGTTMFYLIFRRINPDTRICFLNLKYGIEKATLAKFLKN